MSNSLNTAAVSSRLQQEPSTQQPLPGISPTRPRSASAASERTLVGEGVDVGSKSDKDVETDAAETESTSSSTIMCKTKAMLKSKLNSKSSKPKLVPNPSDRYMYPTTAYSWRALYEMKP
ncbi:Uu.00g143410.m01.CDS01 [Anthostomella pinea]|uniref:Uu.00g143410.m01.CDS01 n=1 Tax=Anthostomella pinea TaxID=933095 RepID=A0AAI8VQQ1_9PEZI|nr:Uu.00g143410.m01.CDS01 [Anthostomella pinea]